MRNPQVRALTAFTALALVATPAATLAHGDDDKVKILYAAESAVTYITREGEVLDEAEAETDNPEVGDRFLATDTVYKDADRTHEIGRNYIQCTFIDIVGEIPMEFPEEVADIPEFAVALMCSGVLELDEHGTMSWSGLTDFTSDDAIAELEGTLDPAAEPFIVVAINGGTFEFVGASGEVAIFDEEAPSDDETWTRYEVALL